MSRTYGVLLRVYTPKADEVAGRVERAVAHVRHFQAVQEEFPALKRIMLLVPSDYDCGYTAAALEVTLPELAHDVLEVPGHHSCEVLNEGVGQLEFTDSNALIVSGKAMSYLTPAVMHGIDQAFADGALVAGLAIDELRDVVLSGRLQNTFAVWHIDALRGIGGFDSRTGVEEVAPLARLVKEYGKCIAPLDVAGGTLDIAESDTARARHAEVMSTKLSRQLAECERVGSSFDEIRSGILSGYQRLV